MNDKKAPFDARDQEAEECVCGRAEALFDLAEGVAS